MKILLSICGVVSIGIVIYQLFWITKSNLAFIIILLAFILAINSFVLAFRIKKEG